MAFSEAPYRHRFEDGTDADLPPGKVVCVGRNYADHIRELGNARPPEPVLFIKPVTALVAMEEPIRVDASLGTWHYETEIAVLVGTQLRRCEPAEARDAIAGVGLAFDFTLRELQSELKAAGQPWEKAKAFDGSCALSRFLHPGQVSGWDSLSLKLVRNGERVQSGNSGQMLFPVIELLCYISRFFTLLPGDVVLTGTPAGVGPLAQGDSLRAELDGQLRVETSVVVVRGPGKNASGGGES